MATGPFASWPPEFRFEVDRVLGGRPHLLQSLRELTPELDSLAQEELQRDLEILFEHGEQALDADSLLAALVEESDALAREQADVRARAAGQRSPVLSYERRANGYKPTPEQEQAYALLPPRDQPLLHWLLQAGAYLLIALGDAVVDELTRVSAQLQAAHRDAAPQARDTFAVVFCEDAWWLALGDEDIGRAVDTRRSVLHERSRWFTQLGVRHPYPLALFLQPFIAAETARAIAERVDLAALPPAPRPMSEELWRAYIEAMLVFALVAYQRLLWLGECDRERGLYLGARAGALPSDDDQAARLLVATSDVVPSLALHPYLLRFWPRRAERILTAAQASPEFLAGLRLRAEQELAEGLVDEILAERHYRLDHLAHVELGGRYGFERILLGPEQHYPQVDGFECGFLAVHRRGSFAGTVQVAREASIDGQRFAASCTPFATNADERRADLPSRQAELLPLTSLLLAIWRDIVVPRVREEHYETAARHEPKGGRVERNRCRGKVVQVEYLPRWLAERRREQAARLSGTLRAVYWVSGFTRRLVEGTQVGSRAQASAAEVGVPLAPWQTWVEGHWRGGTEEERAQAAAQEPVLRERRWRSWDALRLLDAR